MSSYLKYMAQTTSVISPEILLMYQIRQKKVWHPWWELNPRPSIRPIGARKSANWAANFRTIVRHVQFWYTFFALLEPP